METPKTFKELFSGTGIEPTTDESGNTHYNFKATMKEEPKQTAVEWLAEQMLWNEFHNPYLDQAKEMEKQHKGYSEEIVDILDNVRYWETCPNSYKVVIERFIEQFKNK